jgi:UPF0755 protein
MKAMIRLTVVLLFVIICVALASAAFLSFWLPARAEEKFGPPSQALGFAQRVIYSYRLLANEANLSTPLDAQGQPHIFTIGMGESVNSIATRLEEERLITNSDTFRTYLVYAGMDIAIQAGKFQLSPAMTPVEIAHKLQNPVPDEVEFVILPGWRVEEIAAGLPTSGLDISGDDLLSLVANPPGDIFPKGFPQGSLEGFLMPGSYQVKRNISTKDLVGRFTNRFNDEVNQEMRDSFIAHGLNLAQAVTLASIIQREAMLTEEQPVIASVFYNRIAAGMKLESDPTVQYALGYQSLKNTWWKNPLSAEDLNFDSRYNTYVYPGLPPGPISNPSLDALRAVANPATTGYFYFRAQCDGSGRHSFSVTYQEHLNNGCP